ncbi:MAG: ADP-glyceromanno-heptose 6-epimerase [Bacteroidetes bacterium]|nr:ADP-glyceromanno-heptose 6-epimerase [Bacteroidota bacterium]MBT5989551.1 ADP-glyceromanno-heptose 6-epimerase [Bacteroidota bacterium]MBT7826427.1 ADP-glyceromanno-heptose 6-epimerase [Bacteroidota bacterium]
MIVITGAAGFIGSCLVRKLNDEGFYDLVLVDDFSKTEKLKNIKNKQFSLKVDRNKFFNWLDNEHKLVQFIFHLGARTDTTEFDFDILNELNLDYSKQVWQKCIKYSLPLVYASSAATYGGGEFGYDDNHDLCENLKPLNPYGISKNEFDKWALQQEQKPYFWTGLKFFNVYGPNEYHKSRMASVVFHAFNQIQEKGGMQLFRSHKEGCGDGEQSRDFVYVKDVCEVMYFLMHNRKSENNGIYNLGTGKAESFNTLAEAIFESLEIEANLSYIDTPEDIRDKYQYFTEANIDKLRSIGYDKDFKKLKEGIADYVKTYLAVSDVY